MIKIFEERGYPIIKIYENYFEIKAIDYWEFRKFEYSNLKEMNYPEAEPSRYQNKLN